MKDRIRKIKTLEGVVSAFMLIYGPQLRNAHEKLTSRGGKSIWSHSLYTMDIMGRFLVQIQHGSERITIVAEDSDDRVRHGGIQGINCASYQSAARLVTEAIGRMKYILHTLEAAENLTFI